MTEIFDEELDDLVAGLCGSINTEKPAIITNVHNQYLVDVEFDEAGKKDVLYNVPVKHLQTNRAFVFLKLQPGDKGTIKFFDNDVDVYKYGQEEVSTEARTHDINDNYYDFGFYPEAEQYVIPEGEICIGLQNGAALIQIDETGNITLTAQDLTVTAQKVNVTGTNITATGDNINLSGTITLGSNTTIDGKPFLSHTHSNGNQGSPTGGVM